MRHSPWFCNIENENAGILRWLSLVIRCNGTNSIWYGGLQPWWTLLVWSRTLRSPFIQWLLRSIKSSVVESGSNRTFEGSICQLFPTITDFAAVEHTVAKACSYSCILHHSLCCVVVAGLVVVVVVKLYSRLYHLYSLRVWYIAMTILFAFWTADVSSDATVGNVLFRPTADRIQTLCRNLMYCSITMFANSTSDGSHVLMVLSDVLSFTRSFSFSW